MSFVRDGQSQVNLSHQIHNRGVVKGEVQPNSITINDWQLAKFSHNQKKCCIQINSCEERPRGEQDIPITFASSLKYSPSYWAPRLLEPVMVMTLFLLEYALSVQCRGLPDLNTVDTLTGVDMSAVTRHRQDNPRIMANIQTAEKPFTPQHCTLNSVECY